MANGQELILFEEGQRPLTRQEQLTRQFYAWEQRGRGWAVWPYPVALEPPFRPFWSHSISQPEQPFDDGRRPTFLSSLVDRLKGRPTPPRQLAPEPEEEEELEAEPDAWCSLGRMVEIQVALPPLVAVSREMAEQLLLSLSRLARAVSFEVVGIAEAITLQLTCSDLDAPQVWQQLQAYFPEALLTQAECFLETHWQPERAGVIVDFGLSNEFMLPLRTIKSFDVDPIIGTIGALANLQHNEVGMLQVLFQAARAPWAESISRSVTNFDGSAFFADAPDLQTQARHKIARPLFACLVRVASQASDLGRAWTICRSLGASLAQFGSPGGNELMALSNDDYDDIDHEVDLLRRQTHRSGLILNVEELAALVHLPSSSVRTPKLKRQVKKTKAAPALAHNHSLLLGENRHQGLVAPVTLSPEQRSQHLYVIGASGTGKSTLLLNLIRQDMEAGEGLAVLDPHGDLIDRVLGLVPESRIDDVVLFDPADAEYPIGFNILSAHTELEKNLLESDLVSVFRRLSSSWGDQMNSVLSNGLLAFLESSRGGTLADLRRFLVEPDYRREFLRTVEDQSIVYYWQKEFPLLTGRPQAPLLTRLDTFLRPKPIRYMVSQQENKLDFARIMNRGQIFLARLSHGAIGEENAYLLGSLLVSKFHQTALSRQGIGERERRPFYFYIDEFQNFVTPSMAAILAGARKYRLGLVLAHQELRQLASQSAEVASAVLTNPYTRVCFRVGDDDAKKLAAGFSFFEGVDLQNLSTGEAICRMERAEYDFNLQTLPLPEVDPEEAETHTALIQKRSREQYARPRADVEAELIQLLPKAAPVRVPTKTEPVADEQPIKPTVPVVQPLTLVPPPEPPVEAPLIEKPKRRTQNRTKPAAPESLPLGRGGQQHKYLQHLIKRWGEEQGYKATIEKQLPDASGSIDVVLERDDSALACEISITTSVEHEVANLKKCLAAGYQKIALVMTDQKSLSKLQAAATAALTESELSYINFFLPEDLFIYLEQSLAASKNKEEVVKGYKVKVKYKSLSAEEQKNRKQVIAQMVLQAMRRLKESK